MQSRDAVYSVNNQTESVDFILNRQFQWGVDAALFFIAADMQVFMVITPVSKTVYQPGITVEIEQNRLIQCK